MNIKKLGLFALAASVFLGNLGASAAVAKTDPFSDHDSVYNIVFYSDSAKTQYLDTAYGTCQFGRVLGGGGKYTYWHHVTYTQANISDHYEKIFQHGCTDGGMFDPPLG